jgi:energy-coupling factor transporter ATP-binding protein EcfA2
VAKSKESAIASVRKRIVPVADASPYARVLLYGPNGSGKTRIAASGPAHLIIDANEEGTRSVRSYPGVEVFPAKTWEDLVWAYWFLRSGEHEYQSFSIDTLTNMQAACLVHVLKEGVDRDPIKDPAMPQGKDYQKVNTLMKKFLIWYRNLPMHCTFIAQEKQVDTEEGLETMHVPDLSPGARGTAMSCVDFMGHVRQREVRAVNKKTKKEVKRWKTVMLIGPDDQYVTKDRSNMLGRFVVEPTMPQIIEAAKSLPDEE